MIPRGRFHIPSKLLFNSFLRLLAPQFLKNDKCKQFKNELNMHLSSKDIQLGPSCRIVLYKYLKSLNLEKFSEVLITPITIPDIINAILLCDLKPVFVDMDTKDHSFDMTDLRNKLTSNSKVLISTMLSGLDSKRSEISQLCSKEGLLYIEDISQVPYLKYFEMKNSAPVAIQSLSIGKTISTLVGGAIAFKESNSFKLTGIQRPPKRSYFLRQILENAKVDFFTSSFIYRYFTRHLLGLIAKFSPETYFNIHQTNTITKFNENDIFFDDIPTRRHSFPEELFFYFNNWMSNVGLTMLETWQDSYQKRESNKEFFTLKAEVELTRRVASGFFLASTFPVRVPIYVEDPEHFQLYCISKGLDCGNYGLNLCNEEPVFSEFQTPLKNSLYIKKNCFFLNLNEKVKRAELHESIIILNTYFQGYTSHNNFA